VIGEASVLANVMIGGTIEGQATFIEALLALPRKPARRADAWRPRPVRCSGVVGLEMLAEVRAEPAAAQRIAFSSRSRGALMLEPDFLLLDEPAAGLSSDEIETSGRVDQGDQRPWRRRAAGGASCRPDLRHLRPGLPCSISAAFSPPGRRPRFASTRRWVSAYLGG